jgi:DNA-binding transcriptional LysR family regulator
MNMLSMMQMFAQVVEDGSFSATAKRKNISVSSVARQISGLEEYIGARLLNRSTRHHGLTEVGQLFYDNIRKILQDVENAKDLVSSYYNEIKGILRVSIWSSAAPVILPRLPEFLARYPHIVLNVKLAEQRVDLVSEGMDVAVWLANLEDSNLVVRRLTLARRVVCASPRYLETHPEPLEPNDLRNHNCISYTGGQHFNRNIWRFKRDDKTIDVPISGNIRTDTAWALYECVLNGLGVTIIQEWMVKPALDDGRLVRVLSEFNVNPAEFDVPLYAVYPHSRGLPPKSRAFINFLAQIFREFDHNIPTRDDDLDLESDTVTMEHLTLTED